MASIEKDIEFEISIFYGLYTMKRTGEVDIDATDTLYTFEIRRNEDCPIEAVPPDIQDKAPTIMEVYMQLQTGYLLPFLMSMGSRGWYKPNSMIMKLIVKDDPIDDEDPEFIMCQGVFSACSNIPIAGDIFLDLGTVSLIRPIGENGTLNVTIHDYRHNTLPIRTTEMSIVADSMAPETSFPGFTSRALDYTQVFKSVIEGPILAHLHYLLHINVGKEKFELVYKSIPQFINLYKKYMDIGITISSRWTNNVLQVNMSLYPIQVLGHDIAYNLTTNHNDEIAISMDKQPAVDGYVRLVSRDHEMRRVIGTLYGGTLIPFTTFNATRIIYDGRSFINFVLCEPHKHTSYPDNAVQNKFCLDLLDSTIVPEEVTVNLLMDSSFIFAAGDASMKCVFKSLWDENAPKIEAECNLMYEAFTKSGDLAIVNTWLGIGEDTATFSGSTGILMLHSKTEIDPEYELEFTRYMYEMLEHCIAKYIPVIDKAKLRILPIPYIIMPTVRKYLIIVNWPNCKASSESPKDEKGIIQKEPNSTDKPTSKPVKKGLFRKDTRRPGGR